VFLSSQLEWGFPEDFGFKESYYVVETEETSHPLVLEYHDEINLPKLRPPHRYCRIERFKSVLGHMMNVNGEVPDKVLEFFEPFLLKMKKMEGDKIWDFVLQQLKTVPGWRIYYNRIPMILSALEIIPFNSNQTKKYHLILKDFIQINKAWDNVATNRKYFINFRYVCLRLMHRHGIIHPYQVPLLRTSRKKVALDKIFEDLDLQVLTNEVEEMID
jgi:hypothetical protein